MYGAVSPRGLLARTLAAGMWTALLLVVCPALLSGCTDRCVDEGDHAYVWAQGLLPLAAAEPVSVYMVACRAGLCAEGPLDADAIPYGRAYQRKIVSADGQMSVVCMLDGSGKKPTEPSWVSLDCFLLDAIAEYRAGILEAGDSELVWMQIRNQTTAALLVQVDQIVTYEDAMDPCTSSLLARVTW